MDNTQMTVNMLIQIKYIHNSDPLDTQYTAEQYSLSTYFNIQPQIAFFPLQL